MRRLRDWWARRKCWLYAGQCPLCEAYRLWNMEGKR